LFHWGGSAATSLHLCSGASDERNTNQRPLASLPLQEPHYHWGRERLVYAIAAWPPAPAWPSLQTHPGERLSPLFYPRTPKRANRSPRYEPTSTHSQFPTACGNIDSHHQSWYHGGHNLDRNVLYRLDLPRWFCTLKQGTQPNRKEGTLACRTQCQPAAVAEASRYPPLILVFDFGTWFHTP
jgi:hypothetical protein